MKWFLMTALVFVLASPAAAEPPKNLVLRDTAEPIPALQFTDDAGRPQTLDMFRGKVVLLNVGATWCLPCPISQFANDIIAGE